MSSKQVVVLVCDVCGNEGVEAGVETHLVALDGTAVEAEACEHCWHKVVKAVARLGAAGRKPALKNVTKRSEVVPFPGTAWTFSSHALIRMGERAMAPLEVAEAADDPSITHPGLEPALEVRIKGSVKVVVNVERQTIVTVSRRSEDVESVA